MKTRPRDAAVILASVSLDLLALSESARAGLVAFSVSLVILGHYASLLILSGLLGKSSPRLALVAPFLSLAALFALLLVIGLRSPALFSWAAASACAAPLSLSLSAGIEGLLAIRRKAA
jgi:hypothetical protein